MYLPFATKKYLYVQTKILPEPKVITQGALSLLNTFSMSVKPVKPVTVVQTQLLTDGLSLEYFFLTVLTKGF